MCVSVCVCLGPVKCPHNSQIFCQILFTDQTCGSPGASGISGTICMRQTYTLDGARITEHHAHTFTQSFTPSSNLFYSSHQLFLGGGGNLRMWMKPIQTQGEHIQKLHTDIHMISGSNPGSWRCEAAIVAAVPPQNNLFQLKKTTTNNPAVFLNTTTTKQQP